VSPTPPQANQFDEFSSADPGEPVHAEDGTESEIEAEYRRRSAGARNLPKSDRRQALKLAQEWRSAAMRALRDQRMYRRLSDYLMRRSKLYGHPFPKPG
jgi:hypothetical protein